MNMFYSHGSRVPRVVLERSAKNRNTSSRVYACLRMCAGTMCLAHVTQLTISLLRGSKRLKDCAMLARTPQIRQALDDAGVATTDGDDAAIVRSRLRKS